MDSSKKVNADWNWVQLINKSPTKYMGSHLYIYGYYIFGEMSSEEKQLAYIKLETCEKQLNQLMEEYEKLLEQVYILSIV